MNGRTRKPRSALSPDTSAADRSGPSTSSPRAAYAWELDPREVHMIATQPVGSGPRPFPDERPDDDRSDA